MKAKTVSSTINTPEVILDEEGVIKLSGRLISENPVDLFVQIRKWVNNYFRKPADVTRIEISLEYINSVGTKYLLDLLDDLANEKAKDKKAKFKIDWYYEELDEDMFDKGTFLSLVLKVPFNFIVI